MDLRQIRTFVYIAELRSYTRAAAFLHVSQPALSRQMRLLEEELRLKLFLRHGHGVELTNEGVAFFARCRDVLSEFEQLRHDFRSTGANKAVMGLVSVGLPAPATRFATPKLLHAARKSYPGLSVRFAEGFSALLHEWLLSGSLDLAVLFGSNTPKLLTSLPVLVEDLVAISAATKTSRKKNFVNAQDLQNTPLILPHRPHILRELIDSLHLKKVEILEVDSTSLMIELARVGDGTTILPAGSAEQSIRAGHVVALPIINPTLSWQVSICYSSVRPLSVGARVVLDLMRREIAQKVTSGEWLSGRLIRPGTEMTEGLDAAP
ncbi:bacterial regulatory helix-turn-helix, lysR family protein [Paraburkholderia xenovorans LB400]|uniref:Transcriptional regulator, LysR family n=1 Tax=Paraburkholderia xenovorans (strain LB400) TaxID=266265 RepID=Q13HN5_PARXL|nr:LysR substrate-binding domain-containing protein [Paraburkholderia xenovorans]ABE36404.1 transcriptional regulator, LysR family [Paraburkholderia xenovorans LB400]AIP33998.1 bacterial regulatory helix-turn-helix, lysR family protein [Paraburkholderia xenovorans LB400]